MLLVFNDPAWLGAAQGAADALGGSLTIANSAESALHTLVEPSHDFSHLLLEPSAAIGRIGDLLGVTAGETGSQVALVLLGDAHGVGAGPDVLNPVTPDRLAAIMGRDAPARAVFPALSTADVAISFNPNDIECRFQPIVCLLDRRPVGMETLVRMRHPDRGTIGPDAFIPQMEKAGLSLRLTEAVARAAMAVIAPSLLDRYDLFVSLNIPLDVLLFPEALERIDQIRAAQGIPVERLLIEMTESRPVSDVPALLAGLQHWRSRGYRVAIDDMGPEMMNQLVLFDLPFNVVKLDKHIVLRSEQDPLARSYLHRTVENARIRKLDIIAEGIENAAMWTRMRDMGVGFAQGFLVACALPASALPAWLDAWSAQLSLPRDRDPT